MKCAKERSGLKTLIRLSAAAALIGLTASGCLVASYESCIKDRCLILGYQASPLLLSKEGAERILQNATIFLTGETTNGEVLKTVAEDTSVPIVFTGRVDFLEKKVNIDDLNRKQALEILTIILLKEARPYSIEEGWIKAK